MKKKKSSETTGHTFALDEKESLQSALGGPTRGFSENDQFNKYEKAGMSFAGPLDKADSKVKHSNVSRPSDQGDSESLFDYDEAELDGEGAGRPGAGSVREVYAGDPDIEVSSVNDLRFGGEDVSGVSEWSMRATHLELDDGLDAGDFHRSDDDIRNQVYELFNERKWTDERIECDVAGAEVKLKGKVSDVNLQQEIEVAVKDLPGVKEVYNFLEVSKTAAREKTGKAPR